MKYCCAPYNCFWTFLDRDHGAVCDSPKSYFCLYRSDEEVSNEDSDCDNTDIGDYNGDLVDLPPDSKNLKSSQ